MNTRTYGVPMPQERRRQQMRAKSKDLRAKVGGKALEAQYQKPPKSAPEDETQEIMSHCPQTNHLSLLRLFHT